MLANLFNNLNAVCVGQQAALMKRFKINRFFGEVIFDDIMARHANANNRQAQSPSNQNAESRKGDGLTGFMIQNLVEIGVVRIHIIFLVPCEIFLLEKQMD